MRGDRPKPTAIKKAEGNPGKRPLNTWEPSAGKHPAKPKHLTKISSELWDSLCVMLEQMDVLDTADGIALELLCEAYAEWRTCQEFVSKHGSVYTTTSTNGDKMVRQFPQVAQGAEAWRRLRSLITEFGMTPSARVRLGTTEGEEDELTRLLSEMGKKKESRAKAKKKKLIARN